jgi:hypothetical protein
VPSTRVDHLDTTAVATLLAVAQIAVGQHVLDPRKEYLRVVGLCKVVVCLDLEAAKDVFRLGV